MRGRARRGGLLGQLRAHAAVDERIKRAREHLANYDGDDLAEHTLAPNDGR